MKNKSIKDQILALTGLSEKKFYDKYGKLSDLEKDYPKEVAKILRNGGIAKAEMGTFTGGKKSNYTPVNYGDIYDQTDYSVTGSNREMRMQDANLAAQQKIAQNSKKNGLFDILGQLAPGLDMLSNNSTGSSDGAVDGAMSGSVDMADINMRYGGHIRRADNGFTQKMTNFSNTVGQKIGKGYDQVDSSLGKIGGVSGAIGIGGDLFEGYNMIKAEKAQRDTAQQSFDLSNLTRKASQLTPDITERNYVKPEQQIFSNDQFNKQQGVGTNILSARNGMRFSIGEIQNMYNPGDIYSDLEYEPLENNKKYKKGEKIKKAQFGFDKMAGEAGGALGSLIGGGKGKPTGAGKIGSVVGSTVGKFIPIPGADIALSGFGGLVGGIIGGKGAAKTASNLAGAERNLTGQTFETGVRNVMGQNSAFAENGGNFQPQIASELEGILMKRLFAPDPTMDTLRMGGNVRQNDITAMDGNIKATWGGQLKPISYNPHQAGSGQTVLGFGNFHDEKDERGRTGIGLSVGNKNSNPMMDYAEYGTEAAEENSNVEVEPDEPIIEQTNPDGGTSVVVLGNQKLTRETAKIMGNPKLAGKKINKVGLDITMLEKNINDKMEKSSAFLSELNANNPYDKLTQSALQATFKGYDMQLMKLADDKLKLTAIQDVTNQIDKDGEGYDYRKLFDEGKFVSKTNKAKMGAKISTAQKGVTKEQQTEAEKLYKSGNTKGFQEYIQKVAPWMVDEIIKEKGMPKISGKWSDGLQGSRTEDSYQRIMDPRILNTSSQLPSGQPSGKSIADIQSQIASQMDALQPMYTEEYTGAFPERPIAERNKKWLMNAFNQIRPYILPSNAESLDPSQLSGEMMALADNDLRPVQMQTVQSQLASPYTVSFQNRIDEITAGQRAATRLAGYNPAAQSIIGAEAAREKSGIRGDELTTNLALQNEIYNRNRDVVNADRMKNLELYDQQFVRQEQALANTKAVKQAAVNSINAKILQNRLANKQAGLMENLYAYRFDKQGRAINVNPLAQFNTDGLGNVSGTSGFGGMDIEDLEYALAAKKLQEKKQKRLTKDANSARNGSIVSATKKRNYNI